VAEAGWAVPTSDVKTVADKTTEARPTDAARRLALRLRVALVVWVGAEVGLLVRARTGVLMGVEGMVGDLSLVGQSHVGRRRHSDSLLVGWTPHLCMQAPAGHREGWAGLATRAGCASGCSCPVREGCGYVQRSSAILVGVPRVAEGCVGPDL
jgi:hypothetical protein